MCSMVTLIVIIMFGQNFKWFFQTKIHQTEADERKKKSNNLFEIGVIHNDEIPGDLRYISDRLAPSFDLDLVYGFILPKVLLSFFQGSNSILQVFFHYFDMMRSLIGNSINQHYIALPQNILIMCNQQTQKKEYWNQLH